MHSHGDEIFQFEQKHILIWECYLHAYRPGLNVKLSTTTIIDAHTEPASQVQRLVTCAATHAQKGSVLG